MESDFGADLHNCDDDEDDWVQSYADYYVDEDYSYNDEYGASFDVGQKEVPKESLEDLLLSDNILKAPKRTKNHKNKQSAVKSTPSLACDRPRKRKRTKFKSGVELFLNEVLSWHLRDLLSDCRSTLRLPRLVLPSLTYSNFSELTTIVQQVNK
jgi:hypothetical protein